MDISSFFNLGSSDKLINLIAAVIILAVGFIVARILSKLVKKVLSELETNKIAKEQAGVKFPIDDLVSRIVKYAIYITSVILALNQLGLASLMLKIILITLLVILVAIIILAFRDFVPNVVAGFLIYQRNMIKKGELIKIKNIEGRVIYIDLLEIRLMTKDKEVVHIPNSYIIKHELVKMA